MEDILGILVGGLALVILFLGLPWLIFHYITKWKTAATLTTGDEKLLDDLHDAARRLDDRLCTIERIMIADYTGFDVSLVRVCFLAAVFMSGGSVLPFYLIAAMVTPTKPRSLERSDVEETHFWQGVRASPTRAARDISSRFKDIDRRLADIESYVTTENRSL